MRMHPHCDNSAQVSHGRTELLDKRKLPIVCIGDALWNCGLGGGGNLAMQDALDLSTVVLDTDGGFFEKVSGRPNLELPGLVEAERAMLERKAGFNLQMVPRRCATHFFLLVFVLALIIISTC
jgi:hypothetical protein